MPTVTRKLIPNLGPNSPVCASRVNVDQLDEVFDCLDTDYYLLSRSGDNKKISFATLALFLGGETADYDGGFYNSSYSKPPLDNGYYNSTYSLSPIDGGTP
jgi:hypothetical protein